MEKNKKIIIYIGIPASGKSTVAKAYIRDNPNYVRVSRDDFRLMFKNAQTCEPKVEDMITDMVNLSIHKALLRNLNVIIDATNLKVKYINQFIDEFKYSADIDYRVFDISLDKALERDHNREMKVGDEVIKRMFKDYKNLLDSFDFQPVTKLRDRPIVKPDFTNPLPECVIFDIDGTLAHMGKRSAFDWMKVFKDDKNDIVAEQIDFHRSKGRKIILVSGRDGSCRKLTEDWLELYEMEYDELFMRPENDFRKDTLIKKEIYENHIRGVYNPIAVYDDRISVCKFWNELGIFVFTVNQGLIEF